jgi:hypothetical protein
MGTVYLAHDPRLHRLVAIKLLNDSFRDDDELVQRFMREGRVAGGLRHPNIVVVFDVEEDQGRPFIAMEYVEGETLDRVIHRVPPLALRTRIELMEALCGAMAHAHAAGLVHRDIKPANIMVDASGVLKILDFGIARVANSGLTREGVMIGSVNYMSPEQVIGPQIDHRSDIFAAGAVLYEMVALERAFPGDSDTAVLRSILYDGAVPLERRIPDVDPELASIVKRALEHEPRNRYQNADEMRQDLARVRERLTHGAGGFVPTLIRKAPPLKRRSRRAYLATAMAALSIVAGSVTWSVVAMSSTPRLPAAPPPAIAAPPSPPAEVKIAPSLPKVAPVRPPEPKTAAAREDPAAVTLLEEVTNAQNAALVARDDAERSGAPSLAAVAFRQGESLLRSADVERGANHLDRALPAYLNARDRFQAAASEAIAARRAVPAIPEPLPRVDVPVAPPPRVEDLPPRVDERAAIEETLRAYEDAWRARDAAALQQVREVSASELTLIEGTMRDAREFELRVRVRSTNIDPTAGRAVLNTTVETRFVPRQGTRPKAPPEPTTITLEKRQGRWIIVEMKTR